MNRHPLCPQRFPTESMKAYRARRARGNLAVKLHLKGKMAHVSTEALHLPLLGVDPVVDKNILEGKIRAVKLVTPPVMLPPFGRKAQEAPKQFRVGRTKGVTFRKAA